MINYIFFFIYDYNVENVDFQNLLQKRPVFFNKLISNNAKHGNNFECHKFRNNSRRNLKCYGVKMALSFKLLAKGISPATACFSLHTGTNFCNVIRKSTLAQTFSVRHISTYRHHVPVIYRQLQPQGDDKENIFLQQKIKSRFFKGFPEKNSFRKKNDKPKKRRVPKLILVQNPFTWIMIKIDFSVLKNIWDSSFLEKEFKYGTKQAISRVTHLISAGDFAELNGLLTKPARLSLIRELDRNWSVKQRALLALNHEDIQISSPRKVYFIRIADKKYCDVDMAFLALKWVPINSIEALIFTEIFARFHREYTPNCIPEWTIAYFKVTRFEVLRR